MKTKSAYSTVLAETMLAYADAHESKLSEAEAYRIRNLNFRASASVTRDEAVKIMEKACPGYNEFEPALLKLLPEDSRIVIAREGSVCMYINGEVAKNEQLKADEFDYESSGFTRIWWD